ncbi:Radial spoke head protein 4 A [Perkinsus olseni]|uniref:Radial spoke head protein 4 A n=1 Tax=Perkinsus olseni TaxID=32597 RepID=A0A7J6LVF5_PEROL|nr:Radial spoke head protein 4 A [Perkinsus olseni]KAF4663288.1 Radial spoke head protein 4 A [Perkinsus olseni]
MVVSSAAAEQVEAILDTKDATTERTVRSHLAKVIEAMTIMQPADPLEAFEEISRAVRAQAESSPVEDEPEQAPVGDSLRELQELLTVPVDEEGNPRTEAPGLADVVTVQSLLNSAGMGVPPTEAVIIACGLRRLVTSTEGVTKARFWGKVLCNSPACDYLIAEAEMEGGGVPLTETEEAAGADAPGRLGGPNFYMYFVSTDSGRSWEPLPHVLPDQIAAARLVKKILTGDLDAPVITWPPFSGRERELLRAQIARITHATRLVPGNYYAEDEESGEVAANPEYSGISSDCREVASVQDYWRHGVDYLINANGRTSWPEVAEPEDGEEESPATVRQRRMMARESARPMNAKVGAEEAASWTTKCHGDCAQYASFQQVDGAAVKSYVTYGTVSLQSTQWPGAAVVAGQGKHVHTYIGYGMKAGAGGRVAGGPGEIRNTPSAIPECDDPREQPAAAETEEEAVAGEGAE